MATWQAQVSTGLARSAPSRQVQLREQGFDPAKARAAWYAWGDPHKMDDTGGSPFRFSFNTNAKRVENKQSRGCVSF